MKVRKAETTSEWQKTQYANLVRFVSSGTLFARFKARGKLVRQSLETNDLQVAKRRLDDLVHKERGATASRRDGKLTFSDGLKEFRQRGYRVAIGRTNRKRKPIKERTRGYYEERITALLKSWPDLGETSMRRISQRDCEEWADKFSRVASPSAFNHTTAILRQVLHIAIEAGARHDNPAALLGRVSERPKKLQLPSADQFDSFIETIATSGSGWSKPCADLVRFLAFGGFRVSEAANVLWEDCDLAGGRIMVWGDPINRTKNGEFRSVPMIPEMKALLKRMRTERKGAKPSDPVMLVNEAQKAMNRAAKLVGMKRITHHDLRHLFATRCIESGVDIPTVSRWLGHKDGGALAMKVYGHLRDDHSVSMAQKVTFAPAKNLIPMAKEAGV